jgi:hypothetical protein
VVRRSRTLVACGIVLGPLFALVLAAQAATRPGFDLRRHPLSRLALGEGGGVQTANFLAAGLLAVACAVGMWGC